jgi:hypothetical protein
VMSLPVLFQIAPPFSPPMVMLSWCSHGISLFSCSLDFLLLSRFCPTSWRLSMCVIGQLFSGPDVFGSLYCPWFCNLLTLMTIKLVEDEWGVERKADTEATQLEFGPGQQLLQFVNRCHLPKKKACL